MNNELKAELTASVLQLHIPRFEEIPDVGLYLEQVTGYINRVLEPLGGTPITGSMISNYIKKDLVTNPVKKKYCRDQIAGLISVAAAKMVLSLENIQVLMEIQRGMGDNARLYNFFCEDLEAALRYVFEAGPAPRPLEEDARAAKVLIRTTVLAAAHKIYLDTYLRLLTQPAES